jgi:nitrous oxide reductase
LFPPDQFSLKTIEAKQNDNVTVNFYNMEAPSGDRHSFTINAPYSVNLDLAPGKNGTVSFIANHPGIYQFYCEYHEPTMTGQLVVLPRK